MKMKSTYLRKEHFSTTKEVTHLVHSSHQGTFNNSQIIFLLLLVQLYNFIHILVDIIGNALYQRVLNTLFNLCIISSTTKKNTDFSLHDSCFSERLLGFFSLFCFSSSFFLLNSSAYSNRASSHNQDHKERTCSIWMFV